MPRITARKRLKIVERWAPPCSGGKWKAHPVGVGVAGPPRHFRCVGGVGGGQRVGNWGGGSANRLSLYARARDARGIAALFQWSGADQRQLQLESRGAARDDQGIGGDSGLSPPNSGRRRNARAWRDVGAASSRGRQVYGGNRENRLGRGRRRGCHANCGRRGGRRRTARADENVCVVRRGCEVSC